MSYFDQRGKAPHTYLDTSQPLMPFPSSVTGQALSDYTSPPGRAMGDYTSPPGRAMGDYTSPPGGIGDYTQMSNQYRGFATYEPVNGLGVDSSIPVAPSAFPLLYSPPGVKLSVDDPAAMSTLAQYSTGKYDAVNNRICVLQPTGKTVMTDLIKAWSGAGLFVVIVNADPLCGGPSLCGVGPDYIKNLAGTPGWSVFALPGRADSTKANWDKWMSTVGGSSPPAPAPPFPTPGTPPVSPPLFAGISNSLLLLGLVAAGFGLWLVMKKPTTMSANRKRRRRAKFRGRAAKKTTKTAKKRGAQYQANGKKKRRRTAEHRMISAWDRRAKSLLLSDKVWAEGYDAIKMAFAQPERTRKEMADATYQALFTTGFRIKEKDPLRRAFNAFLKTAKKRRDQYRENRNPRKRRAVKKSVRARNRFLQGRWVFPSYHQDAKRQQDHSEVEAEHDWFPDDAPVVESPRTLELVKTFCSRARMLTCHRSSTPSWAPFSPNLPGTRRWPATSCCRGCSSSCSERRPSSSVRREAAVNARSRQWSRLGFASRASARR